MTPVAQSTKTILVADDDKMILEGFKDLFERKGYRVLLAENGELALAWLGKERVDMVFMDIVMPYKEGLETLIEMRRLFPDMPIYSMTGGGQTQQAGFLFARAEIGRHRHSAQADRTRCPAQACAGGAGPRRLRRDGSFLLGNILPKIPDT